MGTCDIRAKGTGVLSHSEKAIGRTQDLDFEAWQGFEVGLLVEGVLASIRLQ